MAVEGNKNAALPLLAACLLTEDECILTNVPRIGDVEVMARLLLDLGAEVDGIGTTTLRIRARQVNDARAGSVAGGPPARVRAAARPAARTHGPRAHRAARRRLPGAAHDFHASWRAAGHGRASCRATIISSRRPTACGAPRCISTRRR
mgnify:CR=1 FL=1